MGLQELRIYLDNPLATYYAGDAVTGKVVVKLSSEEKIRCISAKFKGKANVRWTESHTKRNRQGHSRHVTVSYTAHEKYFEATYYLVGSPSQKITLPPGMHTYSFATTLPQHLPSSFEGQYGHIRYNLKAKLVRPWNIDDKAKAIFTVLSHLDLNLDPLVKEPVSGTNEKTLCCCCCRSGPLTVVANVPCTGFVSGQEIPITVEVDNGTNETVNNVICSLKKNVCFIARSPQMKTRKITDSVATMEFENVVANSSKTWTKKLKIPALPPSTLKDCSIIDLDYCVQVKAAISAPHSDLRVRIPVTLGTIPLLTYVPPGLSSMVVNPGPSPLSFVPTAPALPSESEYPCTPYPPNISAAIPFTTDQQSSSNWLLSPPNAANMAPSAPSTPYPEVPPPSYEECVYGAINIPRDCIQDERKFAPRYPTYNLSDKH